MKYKLPVIILFIVYCLLFTATPVSTQTASPSASPASAQASLQSNPFQDLIDMLFKREIPGELSESNQSKLPLAVGQEMQNSQAFIPTGALAGQTNISGQIQGVGDQTMTNTAHGYALGFSLKAPELVSAKADSFIAKLLIFNEFPFCP